MVERSVRLVVVISSTVLLIAGTPFADMKMRIIIGVGIVVLIIIIGESRTLFFQRSSSHHSTECSCPDRQGSAGQVKSSLTLLSVLPSRPSTIDSATLFSSFLAYVVTGLRLVFWMSQKSLLDALVLLMGIPAIIL